MMQRDESQSGMGGRGRGKGSEGGSKGRKSGEDGKEKGTENVWSKKERYNGKRGAGRMGNEMENMET